jgi:2,3-bisphosphoglycerate-independent phosphoglycerate mutase
MKNLETGAPHTAHTTNKVPLIMSGTKEKGILGFKADNLKTHDKGEAKEELEKKAVEVEEEEGALCDVAPTILELMGIEQPEGMCFLSLRYSLN